MAPRPEEIPAFQHALLGWFERYGRAFPWRDTADPYAVLVAEKLLQQTLARPTVVTAFEEILRRYPLPSALAQAKPEDIEPLIRPLGFAYRTDELLALARALVERHAGQVPASFRELIALPGVGEYATRAVLSFAYGEDVAVVDTNVARLLYRVYGISGAMPANPARKRSLIELASKLLPAGKAKDYNLAVLDLCALVCKPADPRCSVCPIRGYCCYGMSRAPESVGNT